MKKNEDDWLAWRLRDQAKFNSCNQLSPHSFISYRGHIFRKMTIKFIMSPIIIYPSSMGRIVEWLKVNHMKWVQLDTCNSPSRRPDSTRLFPKLSTFLWNQTSYSQIDIYV
jgi:hypothetical protein